MSPSRGTWDESHYGHRQGEGQRYRRANEQYRGSADYGYDYPEQPGQVYAEGYMHNSAYGYNQTYAPAAPYDYRYDYGNNADYTQTSSQRYDYGYSYDQRSRQAPGEYSGYAGYSSYSDYGYGRDGRYYDDMQYHGSRLAPQPEPETTNIRRDQDGPNRRSIHAAPPARRGSPIYGDYTKSQESRKVDGNRSYSTYKSDRKQSESQYQDRPQEKDVRNPSSPGSSASSRGRPAHHYLFSHVNPPTSQRQRSSSPPKPISKPRRTTPTEEYLQAAEKPSWHIDDAGSQRKLIVLDLNGSLLVRSAHQKRPQQPPSQDPKQPRPQQALNVRAVYPRPYLSSFVEYILHPDNKTWLDTMVWSSAQPHSVDDMVNRCFGERKGELKAVWARDTLGLTGDEYHKKTQTYKDLAKPWAELPANGSTVSRPRSRSSSPTIQPLSSPSAKALASLSAQSHSAQTTLLIDDSPVKAALQPYNHLCIPEYVQEMRNHDLRVADAEWESAQAQNMSTGSGDGEKLSKNQEKKEKRREARRAKKTRGISETVPDDEGTLALVQDESRYSDQQHLDPAVTTQADAERSSSVAPGNDVFDPETSVKRIIHEVVMIDGQMVDREPEVLKRVTREVVMIEGKMLDPSDEPPSLVEREVAVSASSFPLHGSHVPPSEFTTAALAWAAAADPAETVKQSSSHRRRRVRRAEKRERERLERLEREEQEIKEREALEQPGTEPGERSTEVVSEQAALHSEAPPQAAQLQALDSHTQTTSPKSKQKQIQYDQTLLAVIGILDYLKQEGNIAGWMKSGGLISVPQSNGLGSSLQAIDDGNRVIVPSNEIHEKDEELAVEAESRPRRARSRTPPTPSGSPSQAQGSPKRRRVDDNAHLSMISGAPSSRATIFPSSSAQQTSNVTEQEDPESVTSEGSREQEADGKVPGGPDSATETKMWFERPAVLAFWAGKGREALAALNLEVIAGIERSNGGSQTPNSSQGR